MLRYIATTAIISVIVLSVFASYPTSIFADEISMSISANSSSESHASSGNSFSDSSSESHVFVTASSSDDGRSSLDISAENEASSTASSSEDYASSESSSEAHIHLDGNDESGNRENQNIGSVTLCKIVADQNGNISNGSGHPGNFSFPEVEMPRHPHVIPTTHFAVPLLLNADLIGHDGVNDAQCITYQNLHLGSYFYAEEEIDGSGWATPLYNDQYTVPVVTLADFFQYSRHFSLNEDDTSAEHWNKNSDGHIVLSAHRPERTVVVLNRFLENTPPISPMPATVVASKIICDNETDLPDWGLGGPDITSHTAQDYVMAHPGCHFANDWSFQWGYAAVTDPGRDFIGMAGNGWYAFGPTGETGTATATIANLNHTNKIFVREVLQEGYIPFTFDSTHPNNSDRKSAEMYCHDDVLDHDNYDFIRNPEQGKTYHCVAWNVLQNVPSVNHAPVIIILGDNPFHLTIGDMFDPLTHATTTDPDGDRVILYASSTVSTTTAGTYEVKYTALDERGLVAEPKTLAVIVEEAPICRFPQFTGAMSVHTLLGAAFSYTLTATSTGTTTPVFTVATSSLPSGLSFSIDTISGTTTAVGTFHIAVSAANMCGTSTSTLFITVDQNGGGGGERGNLECSDGKDNDGDGKIDSADSTCHSDDNPNNSATYIPSKNTENSAPVITLLGATTTVIILGDTFTDPGATAMDAEDGDITSHIIVTGSVSTTTAATSTLRYNVKDSKGLFAEEKIRTVAVNEKPIVVSPPSGGGGGGGSCCGGGGGGGVILLSPSLRIFNETVEKTSISGIVLVKWQTNIPADSRVVYGQESVSVTDSSLPNYGYRLGTAVITEPTTDHAVAVAGINPQGQNYFRPLSKQGSLFAVGTELTLPASECYYLRDFIKFGANNNPDEVKKLQAFLNSFAAENLDVSGFYDIPTRDAVNAFQAKYKVDILDPWGHEAPTGFVYLTTRKQVNEIYCRAAFPLDQNQSAEVAAFKKLLESLKIYGIIPFGAATETNNGETENQTGLVLGTTTPIIGEVGNETATTESPIPVTGRSAFKNMLGAAYNTVSKAIISYWLGTLFTVLVIITGILSRKLYEEDM